MFNIIEKRKILFLIPCVIILAGIISLIAFGGLNTDIDFTGGTAMEIELGKDFNENEIRDVIGSVKDRNNIRHIPVCFAHTGIGIHDKKHFLHSHYLTSKKGVVLLL